jgi:thiamine-phosphate pyrophosphorylase
MKLPRMMLVADGFASERAGRVPEEAHECFAAAVRAGVRWVQLRDHEAAPENFVRYARILAACLRTAREDVLLSVNTYADVAVELGAGLHVGWRGPDAPAAREMITDGVLTVAVHDPDEVRAAISAGADALVFGPVYDPGSKPGATGVGIDGLTAAVRAAGETPVIALGGIHPSTAPECLGAGAYGVAVLSAILTARPAAVPIIVSAFQHALRER